MGRRVRSAKGEQVDFDILTIKAQIAASQSQKAAAEEPKIEVRRQENFIDKRLKRKIAKVVKKPTDQATPTDTDNN